MATTGDINWPPAGTFAWPRTAATDHLALRLAAAKHLALATPVPLPAFLIPTLRRLATDEDPEIRNWANHGLAYEHGWPHDDAKA